MDDLDKLTLDIPWDKRNERTTMHTSPISGWGFLEGINSKEELAACFTKLGIPIKDGKVCIKDVKSLSKATTGIKIKNIEAVKQIKHADKFILKVRIDVEKTGLDNIDKAFKANKDHVENRLLEELKCAAPLTKVELYMPNCNETSIWVDFVFHFDFMELLRDGKYLVPFVYALIERGVPKKAVADLEEDSDDQPDEEDAYF